MQTFLCDSYSYTLRKLSAFSVSFTGQILLGMYVLVDVSMILIINYCRKGDVDGKTPEICFDTLGRREGVGAILYTFVLFLLQKKNIQKSLLSQTT